MPLDCGNLEPEKKESRFFDKPRIYVCEDGSVRVETRHFRQTFSPEEFIALLRRMAFRKAKRVNRVLPVLSSTETKKSVCGLLLIVVCFLFLTGCTAQSSTESTADTQRIITIGGSATEIVYALGAGERLVGVDTSSVYPEAAAKLPQVGYQRTLSAEGVLSLKPSLVIILPEAGPPAAIEQLENAGVKMMRVENEYTTGGAKAKIRRIAEALNLQIKGEELVKQLERDLAEAETKIAAQKTKPKVLFIYARGAGAANVGGRGTPGDAMIKLAGGENAVTEFENYKPLTPEALVSAAPDVILLPTRGLASIGGIEGVLNLPGVRETPAGKNRKIVTLDDLLLLGFTPRLGEGVKELCEKLHQ